ncbi:Ileal sodium/bile acid cotransporter [Holothuria leucospilota]|uniref:Ileal sodium/bile acid cotransporter n=1 Tax=Holothuria leucospilota TaxID=206669 RepID=A0A9Q1CML0_HOLLE|nr:Ileal sodium/bile acid cotransporter [Holothuria leucospilota]
MEDTKLNFGMTIEQLNWITATISLIAQVLTLFSVGCRLRKRDFEYVEKGMCLGLFLQTMILPALGYIIANAFRLKQADALATLATSAAPVASYVGVLTYWAGGNVALSVLLSTMSTTLSIALLPMWFLLYSQLWGNHIFITVDPQDVSFYLCIVIFPVGAGMILQNIIPKFSNVLARQICSCAFLVEITLVAVITALVNPRQFDASWKVWSAAFVLPIVAHFIGFVSAFTLRLSYEKCIAISLAIGVSNSNIVISTGRRRFADSVDLLRLPEMYAVFAPIQGVVWALFFNRFSFITDKYPNLFGSREFDEV